MASKRYHLNKRGIPGRCRANVGPCPLGSSTEHYSTPQEAREAFESKQVQVPPPLKKGLSEALALEHLVEVKRARRGGFSIPEFDEYMQKDFVELAKRYGRCQWGTNRAVFDRGDGFVVKLATCDYGLAANDRELSKMEAGGSFVAEGYREYSTSGFPLVVMEKVEPLLPEDERYPSWAGSVDCGQVGVTKDGRVVAFDL